MADETVERVQRLEEAAMEESHRVDGLHEQLLALMRRLERAEKRVAQLEGIVQKQNAAAEEQSGDEPGAVMP